MANNEDRLIARVVAAVKSWLEQRNIGGGDGGDPRDLDGDGRVTRRERTAAKRADRLAQRNARKARRDSGLLPGMTREQTADFRRMEQAQADRDAQQNNKPQPPPPAPVGANVANQAAPNFDDQLRAVATRESEEKAKIEAALADAKSSADTDVNDGATGVIGDVGLQGVAGDTTIIRPHEEKNIGKANNLNPQPGFVTLRAENEDGKRKCFGVLGYEASGCGDGPAVRTVWWEPEFGFGTGTGVGVGTGLGTGDGPPSVSIAKGLNLVPSTNTYGEHHPETLWKAIFTAANGTHELTPGATNYLWVKITYSEREVLVADELWQSGGVENYDIDFDFGFDFGFTGRGTGAGTGTGIATVHAGLDMGSSGVGSGCECGDVPVTGYAYFTGDNEMLVPVYTDVYGEVTGSGSGSGTGYTYKPEVFDGSIKQYMLHTSSAPVVVTPITTSSTAPADTKTVKHQFLGSVTLNDKGEITEWEWRLNHAFYWNAPDFVAGSYGKTEKSPPPNYDPPDIS